MAQRSNIESGRKEILFGIFSISMAVMILEIALTRVFSVTLWYHFAFMIVSIALLGFGVSGVFLSLFPFLSRRNMHQNLVILANLFALSSLGAFILCNRIPLNILKLHPVFPPQFLYLTIYFLSYALPFFLAGLCIGICLVRMPGEVNRIYSSSLLGSGLGCIVIIYILSKGAVSAIFLASLFGLLAALSFGMKRISKKARIAMAIAFVALFVLFINCEDFLSVRMAPNKALEGREQYMIFKKWNAISRVDVFQEPGWHHVMAMNKEACQSPMPPQLAVTIDGLSLTPITKFDGDLSTLKFIEASTISLPYELKKNPKVLAIGFGGGLDILGALYYQASSIVGVELNPIIVDLVKGRYRDFSGRLDGYNNVRLYTGEGRSFIKRLDEEFDIIQLHGTDTLAATSSGALSLSENYLYTVEAVRDYYSHLRKDGILAMSRWVSVLPRETLRLVSIVIEALKREGIEKPENHIIIVTTPRPALATLLVKKSEFTDDEIREIHSLCRNKFLVIYTPQMDAYPSGWRLSEEAEQAKAIFRFFIEKEDKTDFYRRYAYNILPVTDNNPFFFHYFKWTTPLPLLVELKERPIEILPSHYYLRWKPEYGGGMTVLIAVLIIALFLSSLLILLPLYSFKRRTLDAPGKGRFLTYFFCLGIGFMFIEIALMQKFILFLGYPTYSISVVLASLLVFSGIGSYITAKLKRKMLKGLTLAIFLLAGIVCSYQLLFPHIFRTLLQGSLAIRILSSLLMLSPLGFLMGMPFPIGIMLVNRYSSTLIPWVWGVNGFASVLGSIFAAILAISFGFSMVFLLASIAYLIALFAIFPIKGRV